MPKDLAIRIDRMRRLGSAFDKAHAQAQRICGDITENARHLARETALKPRSSRQPPARKG